VIGTASPLHANADAGDGEFLLLASTFSLEAEKFAVTVVHKPSEGAEYLSGINGQRIAIVGYSHWNGHPDRADHDEFTLDVIRHVSSGTCRLSFFTQIGGYFGPGDLRTSGARSCSSITFHAASEGVMNASILPTSRGAIRPTNDSVKFYEHTFQTRSLSSHQKVGDLFRRSMAHYPTSLTRTTLSGQYFAILAEHIGRARNPSWRLGCAIRRAHQRKLCLALFSGS
jgi:hypothetical protein